MPILFSLLLAFAVTSARSAECATTVKDIWDNSVNVGERLFLVDEAYAPEPGWDMRIMCHAKGANGKVMDPFMDTKLHGTSATSAMFWLFARMSCASDLPGLGVEADYTDPAARSCEGNATAEAGSGDSAAGVGERRMTETCMYPINEDNQPSSYTGLQARHWPHQSGWYGPLMSIWMDPTDGEPTQEIEQTHALVATEADGTSAGSACFLTSGGSDAGDGYASEEERVKEARRTWYTGGVMGTVKREAFTMRSFHFASESMKTAAMAVASDTVNPGLQYAKSYAGRNGCDVEIVLEFQPQSGGGLEMQAKLQLESLAKETEAALRYSVRAYATDTEIVVTAGLKEMREAQFLEPLSCEEGAQAELIRFSKSFVCKATKASVEAQITFHRADGSMVAVPTTPVAFQTSPPTAIEYESDETTRRYPFFNLKLEPSQAPESCETLYWDPLLASITFDSWQAAPSGVAEPESQSLLWWILGGVAALLVAVAVAAVCYCRRLVARAAPAAAKSSA